jgi:hypothetical protein
VKIVHLTLAAGAVIAATAVALGAFGTPANAQKSDADARTPSNWSYEIRKGGRRLVARGAARRLLHDGAHDERLGRISRNQAVRLTLRAQSDQRRPGL